MKTLLDAINDAQQIIEHSRRKEIEKLAVMKGNRNGPQQARENLADCITQLHRVAGRFPTGNATATYNKREYRAELRAQGREMTDEINNDFDYAIAALRLIENYRPILGA